MNGTLASSAARATWEVPILLMSAPLEQMVSAPTSTTSTSFMLQRTALSMIRVEGIWAAARSLTVSLPPRARLGGIDADVLAISVGGLDDAQRGLAVAMGEDGHPAFQPLGADPSNYFNGLTGPFYETVGVGYH